MPIEIRMPALSPTMTEGNLARWLKQEGEEVHSGDVIAEIETDKATMEYEAADEGRLGKIIVPEGAQGIKVNQPIALLLEEGEDPSELEKFAGSPAPPIPAEPKTEVSPAPAVLPHPHPSPPPLTGEGVAGTPAPAHPPPQAGEGRVGVNGPAAATNDRIFASPLARRMAVHAGLDLASIRGSGPQGRIVKVDIERALGQPGTAALPAAARTPEIAPPPVAPLPADAPFEKRPHSAMRRVIARRMSEAKQTIPHFYMSVDCVIDELLRARAMLNADRDAHISVNDFVVRAAALALRQVPSANAAWSEDAIIRWQRADISVAVALDDGLITPIVRGADVKGLAQIAAETKDLAERARAGKLKLEEFQGGTFTISNLGMYGIREFAAVINPGQGGILAIGAGEKRPVVKDGQLTVATVMTCTLSGDHRAVDGAVGAQFLQAFKRLIEEPARMLL